MPAFTFDFFLKGKILFFYLGEEEHHSKFKFSIIFIKQQISGLAVVARALLFRQKRCGLVFITPAALMTFVGTRYMGSAGCVRALPLGKRSLR